jgi:hypothetical protein
MSRVLAAIDGTAASPVVLAVATEVGRLLSADVDAVHVVESAAIDAEVRVEGAEVKLRLLEGAVAPVLVSEASAPEVDAVVVGLRRLIGAPYTAGHVALDVIDHSDTIVVAVPPAVPLSYRLRTVLVPVQPRPAEALRRVVRLAQGAHLDLVILHVHDETSIPAFEDQSHYDTEVWADEFLARWVPGARYGSVVEVRVGTPVEVIIGATRDRHADMLALGWDRDRSHGRASVVRAALARSAVPVALLPVRAADRSSHAG